MFVFFVFLLLTVKSQVANIVAHGDNIISVLRSDDGGITFSTIIPTHNTWVVPVRSSESNINGDTVFRFIVTDIGYIGGFIASIDYNCKSYYTSNPLSTSNFELVSSSDNNLNLVYRIKSSAPWGISTSDIDNNAYWVWNGNVGNTMTFDFDFSNINSPCNPLIPNNNCFDSYDECRWWGDPHTLTFDGKWHHYQGEVFDRINNPKVYSYVSPCTNNFNIVPFQILVGHRKCPSSTYLCTWFLWIRFFENNNRVRTLTLWQNGVTDSLLGPVSSNTQIGLSFVNPNAYYIWDASTRILYFYSGKLCNGVYDFAINANTRMTKVNVNLNEYYKYLVCGLCGYYSDCISDDFVQGPSISNCQQISSDITDRMGQYTLNDWSLINEFGDSWVSSNGRRRLQSDDTREYIQFDEDELLNVKSIISNLFPDNDDIFYENCASELLIICPNLEISCILGACQPDCIGTNCGDENDVEMFVDNFIPLPDEEIPVEENDDDEYVPPY